MTPYTLSRMLSPLATSLAPMARADLLGVPEIAELLGVDRRTVWRYVSERDDWPPPAAQGSGKRLWERDAVERWRKKNPPSKYDRFRRPE